MSCSKVRHNSSIIQSGAVSLPSWYSWEVHQLLSGEAEQQLGRQSITVCSSPCKGVVPQAFRHIIETILKYDPTFKQRAHWEPSGNSIHAGREMFKNFLTEVWTLILHTSGDCPSRYSHSRLWESQSCFPLPCAWCSCKEHPASPGEQEKSCMLRAQGKKDPSLCC